MIGYSIAFHITTSTSPLACLAILTRTSTTAPFLQATPATMHSLVSLLAFAASASACLIANFQYFPIPSGTAKARPHLVGNLTSTTHPAYPSPICWLSKMKLESPNDMYPLYCIDPGMTAYIWMEGLDPVPGSFFPGLSAKGERLG